MPWRPVGVAILGADFPRGCAPESEAGGSGAGAGRVGVGLRAGSQDLVLSGVNPELLSGFMFLNEVTRL